MQRRTRTASAPQAESRVRAITRQASDAAPSEAPIAIPPPPYGAGEPPPPEPPPDPPPGPQIRYEDDGGLGFPPGTGEVPGPDASDVPEPDAAYRGAGLHGTDVRDVGADVGPWDADYEAGGPPDAYGAGRPGAPKPRRAPAMPPASFTEERSGPLERIRNLVTGDELDPGRPGLRILIVVGVIAALVAGWYWWHAQPREQPLAAPSPARPVAASPQPAPGTPAVAPMASGGNPTGASPSATTVVVDVAGKVRHPGVVHLPPGSRVIDAIHAAGGAKPGAPLTSLNLARVLVDGEQIVVGTSAAPTPGAVPQPGTSPGASSGTTVSLNTATEDQLEALPGIGPALAKRILDYRTQHGGFRSVDELQDVSGIGPKRFADLKSQVTL